MYFYSFIALVSAGHDLHSTDCSKGILLEKKVKIWTKFSRTISVEAVVNNYFCTNTFGGICSSRNERVGK